MKVYIPAHIHAEIMYFVNKSNIEISGLGRLTKLKDGSFMVSKVYLLKQENSSASTDLCEEAVANLLYESREDKGDLNFWWHSHVNMGVFWSGTDMDTIKQFGKKGYLVSTVFNKKGEHRTSYFQGATDFLPEIFLDELKTEFRHIPMQSDVDRWEKEYTEKCATKSWNTSGICGTGGYGGSSGRWDNTKYSSASGIGENAPSVCRWVAGTKLYAGMDTTGLTDYQLSVVRELEATQKEMAAKNKEVATGSTPSGADYKGDSFTTKPVEGSTFEGTHLLPMIGEYSGSTAKDLIDFMYTLFHSFPSKAYDDLTAEEYAMLYDLHLCIFDGDGEQPEDRDLQWLLNDVSRSIQSVMEYEYDILEFEKSKIADEEDEVADEDEIETV